MEISLNMATTLKEKPADESKLGFGQIFTDHMLLIDYDSTRGWHNPKIEPYGDLKLDPGQFIPGQRRESGVMKSRRHGAFLDIDHQRVCCLDGPHASP